ncbi:hypothetical protein E8E13_000632 [Curvularia kusanoi]|uniref:Uncharacterized protein n=1 Tax=Curvularia kusanoi TaxID=90978 RepID=A0A9P4T5J5_CURKU|nr:hypothetical protein E8E13_000632 [Curvularia kusanoi]
MAAAEWAESQRSGWLCQLYGTGSEDGTRSLPPDCIQSRLLSVLESLLSFAITPSEAAAQTTSLILTQKDVHTPWSNHIGLYYGAAHDFEDGRVLNILVDYLAELASLPDAINEGPEAKTTSTSFGDKHIEPGQPIVFETGKLWSDLPEFSWHLTESLQGPEQYLKYHGGRKEPLGAMQAWKNLNTYLALRAIHPKAQSIPAMAGGARLGVRTLAMATEQSSDSRLGRNSGLHAPAAAQWLRIAGREIEQLCKEETELWPMGKLWEEKGGLKVCDGKRLAFWRDRLTQMGY